MSKTQNYKIIDVDGKKLLIGSLNDIYKKLKTQKGKDEFEEQLGKKILNSIKNEIDAIVKKTVKIKSVNAVQLGNYYNILNEAIDSYAFGYYLASIACCGSVSEKISYELSLKLKTSILSDKDFECLNQNSRLLLLYLTKIIDQKTFLKLDKIRTVRNSYIHNNLKNNKKDEANAKICINNLIDSIKLIYKP